MSKVYTHILRAMKPGDEIYIAGCLDRDVTAVVHRAGGKAKTSKFVAIKPGAESVLNLVRVTMIVPLMTNEQLKLQKGKRVRS